MAVSSEMKEAAKILEAGGMTEENQSEFTLLLYSLAAEGLSIVDAAHAAVDAMDLGLADVESEEMEEVE